MKRKVYLIVFHPVSKDREVIIVCGNIDVIDDYDISSLGILVVAEALLAWNKGRMWVRR